MRKHIPNLLTLLNLSVGTVAIYMVLTDGYSAALILLLLAAVFDFSDGFAARLLNVRSEIGKQLDSLADMVSFGLVPVAMIFMSLKMILLPADARINELEIVNKILMISVCIVPMFSALRLARFNLQQDEGIFLGLPTPAFALFWSGIYYDISANGSIFGHSVNVWLLWGLMLMTSLFMVIPLPMLTLKFKNFRILPNFSRYILILLATIIICLTGISGLSLVILAYILVSLVRIVLT